MDNITFFEHENFMSGEKTDYVLIDRGNNEFTSMPKSIYDTQQAVVPPTFN